MDEARAAELVAKLEKGISKTQEILRSLGPDQWQRIIFEEPYVWSIKDLVAHLVSAEDRLLLMAKDIAGGGEGAPTDFDFGRFNQSELERLGDFSTRELLVMLSSVRQDTLEWVRSLGEGQFDMEGRHPALGPVDLGTMISSIYGHQLIHMREIISALDLG